MPTFVSLVSTTLLAVLMAACASPTDLQDPDYGVSAVLFQDMVVPANMQMVDQYNESHSREAAGWRYGDYHFYGRMPVAEASAYLLQRMPDHDWKVTGQQHPDENTHKLSFERGRYRADYTLERRDGTTRIHIEYRTEITSK
jgi:hypothetical protein